MNGYFITGTDTGIGKTRAACALLAYFSAQGKSVVGMKPVACGDAGAGGDVAQLVAASNVAAPRAWVNPYAFASPIAPQLAAEAAGARIEPEAIQRAFTKLQSLAEAVIVEGVGGFCVPLNARQDTSDMAKLIGLPVILVVGIRLGCLNHALLTRQAIDAAGLPLAGWVANLIDPQMLACEENIAALEARLACPRLATLPFRDAENALENAAEDAKQFCGNFP